MSELNYRSEYLLEVFDKYEISKEASILEIGCGNGRNLFFLERAGYENVIGIDKEDGTAIEDVDEKKYDVIFTMSCLFLIPEKNEWVFEKIANMTKEYLFTLEGELSSGTVIGRNYGEIFKKLGFEELEHRTRMFNRSGHLRVFKKL